ncbi:DUF1304 domain-containing protein [bacterium]|nr:DUF1304 domain-containing protein [bacterium]
MITNILILLVALLHFYFLILEMFLWTTPKGIKTFGMTLEKARDTEALAANQGLYNGFLSAGLIWGLVHPDKVMGHQVQIFFLSCVIIAGAYGAYSVNRKIFFIQALPAIIALGFCLLF